MSMMSAQCDELRKIADELQNLIGNGHNYTWSGLFSTLHYAQQGLRSAADTIWELSCKLTDLVDQSEEIRRLEAENSKLRELVRELWGGYNDPRCEECHLKDTPTCVDCPICAREAAVIDRMREMGIEVE